MRLDRHRSADRLLIARLQGIAERYASRAPLDLDAATAELHAVTTDAHLLGHAWPHDSAPLFRAAFPDPWIEQKRTILTAAGAEPQPPWWEEPTA